MYLKPTAHKISINNKNTNSSYIKIVPSVWILYKKKKQIIIVGSNSIY
jgi:hypothetical protein